MPGFDCNRGWSGALSGFVALGLDHVDHSADVQTVLERVALQSLVGTLLTLGEERVVAALTVALGQVPRGRSVFAREHGS